MSLNVCLNHLNLENVYPVSRVVTSQGDKKFVEQSHFTKNPTVLLHNTPQKTRIHTQPPKTFDGYQIKYGINKYHPPKTPLLSASIYSIGGDDGRILVKGAKFAVSASIFTYFICPPLGFALGVTSIFLLGAIAIEELFESEPANDLVNPSEGHDFRRLVEKDWCVNGRHIFRKGDAVIFSYRGNRTSGLIKHFWVSRESDYTECYGEVHFHEYGAKIAAIPISKLLK